MLGRNKEMLPGRTGKNTKDGDISPTGELQQPKQVFFWTKKHEDLINETWEMSLPKIKSFEQKD